MKLAKTWQRLLAPLLIALVAGCAPAYRCYSGCCVRGRYGAPAPLPYARYDECDCRSSATSQRLAIPQP